MYVEIQPYDATDRGYNLTIDNPSVADFIGPLTILAYTQGHVWVTVQTYDGGYSNQCEFNVITPLS